jgi:hypothetical protein
VDIVRKSPNNPKGKKKIEEKKSKFGNDIEDVMDSLLIVLLH